MLGLPKGPSHLLHLVVRFFMPCYRILRGKTWASPHQGLRIDMQPLWFSGRKSAGDAAGNAHLGSLPSPPAVVSCGQSVQAGPTPLVPRVVLNGGACVSTAGWEYQPDMQCLTLSFLKTLRAEEPWWVLTERHQEVPQYSVKKPTFITSVYWASVGVYHATLNFLWLEQVTLWVSPYPEILWVYEDL